VARHPSSARLGGADLAPRRSTRPRAAPSPRRSPPQPSPPPRSALAAVEATSSASCVTSSTRLDPTRPLSIALRCLGHLVPPGVPRGQRLSTSSPGGRPQAPCAGSSRLAAPRRSEAIGGSPTRRARARRRRLRDPSPSSRPTRRGRTLSASSRTRRRRPTASSSRAARSSTRCRRRRRRPIRVGVRARGREDRSRKAAPSRPARLLRSRRSSAPSSGPARPTAASAASARRSRSRSSADARIFAAVDRLVLTRVQARREQEQKALIDALVSSGEKPLSKTLDLADPARRRRSPRPAGARERSKGSREPRGARDERRARRSGLAAALARGRLMTGSSHHDRRQAGPRRADERELLVRLAAALRKARMAGSRRPTRFRGRRAHRSGELHARVARPGGRRPRRSGRESS